MDAHDHILPHFNFDNSFARSLKGFYASCEANPAIAPKFLLLNQGLAEELGLDPVTLDSEAGLAIFSGNVAPEGSEPLAQVYAGHQFGGFTPQLGDGRALLLGEVIDCQHRRRDIQLKGSGRTPFSRGGDGKAALGPVLREYLIGESMHALGVPTTRALAAVTTGELVQRETPLPGAVLTATRGAYALRVAGHLKAFERRSVRRSHGEGGWYIDGWSSGLDSSAYWHHLSGVCWHHLNSSQPGSEGGVAVVLANLGPAGTGWSRIDVKTS